jgi:hypothetical protein
MIHSIWHLENVSYGFCVSVNTSEYKAFISLCWVLCYQSASSHLSSLGCSNNAEILCIILTELLAVGTQSSLNKSWAFEICIVQAIAILYKTPSYLRTRIAGVKFSHGKCPKIRVLAVKYDSNHSYSLSFSDMDNFFWQVETWVCKELSKASPGMRNGGLVSDLEFYDLQRTL